MTHDDPLFPGFKDDPATCLAAAAHWQALCDRVLSASSRSGWQFRGPTRFGDGSLECEGNPIFDLLNEEQAKAVRLIQDEVTADRPPSVRAYMDVRGEDDSIRELVVRCELTERTAARVAELIEEWTKPETTPDEMRSRL